MGLTAVSCTTIPLPCPLDELSVLLITIIFFSPDSYEPPSACPMSKVERRTYCSSVKVRFGSIPPMIEFGAPDSGLLMGES